MNAFIGFLIFLPKLLYSDPISANNNCFYHILHPTCWEMRVPTPFLSSSLSHSGDSCNTQPIDFPVSTFATPQSNLRVITLK